MVFLKLKNKGEKMNRKEEMKNIDEIIKALQDDLDTLDDKEQEVKIEDLRACVGNLVYSLIEIFQKMKVKLPRKKNETMFV